MSYPTRHLLPAALIAAAVLARSAYGQSASPEILSPGGDAPLDAPAAAVVLRFPVGAPVTLRVNGAAVSPTLIGRTETDAAARTVTQTWYGVVLQEGANILVAEAGPGGARAERTVEVQTAPRRPTLRALGARLPADGRSTLVVTGALLDAQGHPSHHDGLVTLTAGSGEWVGEDAGPDQPGFQVRTVGGQFRATLRAGVRAQTVRVRAAAAGGLEAFTAVEFTTDLRPSLATGVVDVRLGSRRSDYDRPIQDFISPEVSDIARLQGRTSVFATGKVGEYLFTGAYDSEHALNQTAQGPSSLGRDTQTRDRPYPVYGDSSTAYALAQSRDNLALRLERDQNFLLWGDYGTAEFAGRSQEFTAVTRSFHALKANYQFGAVQATGFYGDNVQGFQRDTSPPTALPGFTSFRTGRSFMAARASSWNSKTSTGPARSYHGRPRSAARIMRLTTTGAPCSSTSPSCGPTSGRTGRRSSGASSSSTSTRPAAAGPMSTAAGRSTARLRGRAGCSASPSCARTRACKASTSTGPTPPCRSSAAGAC